MSEAVEVAEVITLPEMPKGTELVPVTYDVDKLTDHIKGFPIDFKDENSETISFNIYKGIIETVVSRYSNVIMTEENKREFKETRTFLNKHLIVTGKARVEKFKAQGGLINQDRAIYLQYPNGVDYITYGKYLEMLAKYNTFVAVQGRQPNYITTTNSSTPSKKVDCFKNPRWYSNGYMKQETSWYCGCNSLEQILYELTGNHYSESNIAKLVGTTQRGSDPDAMVKVLKILLTREGLTVKRCEWIYKDDISWEQIGEIIQNPKQSVCNEHHALVVADISLPTMCCNVTRMSCLFDSTYRKRIT